MRENNEVDGLREHLYELDRLLEGAGQRLASRSERRAKRRILVKRATATSGMLIVLALVTTLFRDPASDIPSGAAPETNLLRPGGGGAPDSAAAGVDPTSAVNPTDAADALDLTSPTLPVTPYDIAPVVENRLAVETALAREYPTFLHDAGVGGSILVHFSISAVGTVDSALVAESSGYPELDAAALRVARAFRFLPALREDRPIPVWIQAPITFLPP